MGDYGRARGSASTPSGFAPLELGLALPLLARRVTLCLAAGFAPGLRRLGRGRLAPRLCPRLRLGGRRLGPPPGLRLRIPCCPFGLVGPLGTVRPLGTVATLRTVGPVRSVWVLRTIPPRRLIRPVRAVWSVRALRPIGPVRLIALLAATSMAAVVIAVTALVTGARPLPRGPDVGRRNDADTAEIASPYPHPTSPVVVHRALPHAREEVARALSIRKDEAWLGPQRPREHHPRATVVPVGVVVGIVEDHDPEADTGVVVRAPVRIAHVRVAVVAQEPRIVVVLLDIVRDDVVVPVAITVRDDALRQLG